MRRAVLAAALGLLLPACGGTPASKLAPAPLIAASWTVSHEDCVCPGASVRRDYTEAGVHVVFCTWACATYTTTMQNVPDADHAIVTLEMGYLNDRWELLGEDVQSDGHCL